MAAVLSFLHVLVFVVVFSFLSAEDELKTLDDINFEHLTQASTGATTGDWLIVFSRDHNDCSQCKDVENIFIKLSAKFQHKLNIAKVLPSSKLTIKRFEITKWPAVSLFHHGHQYYYTSDQYSEESLTVFSKDYDKQPNRKVPDPITMFDVIVEDIMDDVKHVIHVRKNAALIIFFSGILFGLMLMPILKCVADFLISTFSHDEEDDEDEKEDEDNEVEEKEEEKSKEQKKDD
ncbi:thioredoxin domain-containing protein-like [Actinia tenebrosa]|uniref:Thioredoxin domain-containing protein-like n=1 Tax=Actinia tenebrosa TaxID=6105 RepID=A0A6P8IMU2_ACTTE|nr:thioredoxin domain-containing protein-like [Actinia tenebrosa]